MWEFSKKVHSDEVIQEHLKFQNYLKALKSAEKPAETGGNLPLKENTMSKTRFHTAFSPEEPPSLPLPAQLSLCGASWLKLEQKCQSFRCEV